MSHLIRSTMVALATFTLGASFTAALSGAHAEPPPSIDRSMVERLVRAEESQVRALEKLTAAVERCRR